MSVMIVMSEEGDTRLAWNPDVEDEVAVVKEKFDELISTGWLAYGKTDEGDVMLRDFDPTAEEILMAIPLVGG